MKILLYKMKQHKEEHLNMEVKAYLVQCKMLLKKMY